MKRNRFECTIEGSIFRMKCVVERKWQEALSLMEHKRVAVNLFEHCLEHSRIVGREIVGGWFNGQGRAVAPCFFMQIGRRMVAIIREYMPSAVGTDSGCNSGVETFVVGSHDCYAGTGVGRYGSCTTGWQSVLRRGVKQRCRFHRTVQLFRDKMMFRRRYCDLGPIIYTAIPERRR